MKIAGFAMPMTVLLAFVTGPLAAETRWFVVSEIDDPPAHRDAYLLPLSDSGDIDQARRLIADGPGGDVGSIAVARIAAGADGFNRNVLAPEQLLWSWHVAAFIGFADSAIELCDGWPGFVEEDVGAYIDNTDATICFWGYTVTAELESPPAFEINRNLSGAWFNPQTPGQGLMIDVSESDGLVFAAWFTFDEGEKGAKIGDPAHRWLTAQGAHTGALADLDLTLTTGGRFDDAQPVENSPPGAVGRLLLRFDDCSHGTAEYVLAAGNGGAFPIQRLLPLPGCGAESEVPGD